MHAGATDGADGAQAVRKLIGRLDFGLGMRLHLPAQFGRNSGVLDLPASSPLRENRLHPHLPLGFVGRVAGPALCVLSREPSHADRTTRYSSSCTGQYTFRCPRRRRSPLSTLAWHPQSSTTVTAIEHGSQAEPRYSGSVRNRSPQLTQVSRNICLPFPSRPCGRCSIPTLTIPYA